MTQFVQQNAMIHSIKSLMKVNKTKLPSKLPQAKLPSSRAFIIASVRFNRAYEVE